MHHLGLQNCSPEQSKYETQLETAVRGVWPEVRHLLAGQHPLACLGRVAPQGDAGTVQAQARLRLLLEPSYAVLEFELASALHCIINSHWKRLLQNAAFRPTVQVEYLSLSSLVGVLF